MNASQIGKKLDEILLAVKGWNSSKGAHQQQIIRAESWKKLSVANQIQLGTGLLLLATVIISMKSYSISRDSLDTAQRAFLNPTRLEGATVRYPTSAGILDFYEVRQIWENDGGTPAPEVISYIHYTKMPSSDSDSWTFVTPTSVKFRKGFAGPHSDVSAQSTQIPVKDLADSKNNLVVWGWMAYKDVFPNTETHVTEFCNQVASVSQPQNTSTSGPLRPAGPILDQNGEPILPIKVSFYFCARHNCVDEGCDDYKLIASKLSK